MGIFGTRINHGGVSRRRVGGAWVAGAQSDDFKVTDPASGAVLGSVAKLNADDSRAAVDAAHAAFPHWAGLLPQERGAATYSWRILNGQSFVAATIHQIDKGIDSGPILFQKKVLVKMRKYSVNRSVIFIAQALKTRRLEDRLKIAEQIKDLNLKMYSQTQTMSQDKIERYRMLLQR